MRYLLALLLLLMQPPALAAAPIQAAVASNFANPLRELAALYHGSHPDTTIQLTVASTGKLAAQIRQGAPFDLFLAADVRRPAELEQEGLIVAGSRKTYALGRLVLWSARPGLDLGVELLESGALSPLALANSRLAPYGVAAEAVLAGLALPDTVKLVRGVNVAQTLQFARSGAARAAFVAFSQVHGAGGSLWLPQESRYPAIVQQGVLLNERAAAAAFYRFLFSAEARALIQRAGYGVPEATP